ncbi:MAG: sigma-70 family RNA polymerase sigma factor [Anaerolineae bacterium]
MAEPDEILLGWVDAARRGDQEAFAEIVYSFTDAVYNLCYRMLGDAPEAEDATQEAFIRAYNHLGSYDPQRSFKTWLLSIASNHCIDRIRKRRMTVVSLDEPLPSGSALEIASGDPLPEDVMLRRERSAMIQRMLDELAPEYRAAVVLRYWYDYSYSEIAVALNTTESAIKSRLFRARQMLAEQYGHIGEQPPVNRRLLEG